MERQTERERQRDRERERERERESVCECAVAEQGVLQPRAKYIWAPLIGVVEIHLRAK